MSIDEAVQEKDYFKDFHSIWLADCDPSNICEHPGTKAWGSCVKFPLYLSSRSGGGFLKVLGKSNMAAKP